MMRKIILFFAFLLPSFIWAQKGNPTLAMGYLSAGNYEQALDEYLFLLNQAPNDKTYNYRVGVCFLNTNINKAKAIPYLEKVINLGNFENNTRFLLGRAYHFNYQFDKAIEQYNLYKKGGLGTAATLIEVEKQIEYCYNGKELIKFPMNVKFENLGPKINSLYSDYYPFFNSDESFVMFNSTRPLSQNDESSDPEEYSIKSNIYNSQVKQGEFSKAALINESINTLSGTEEIVGLSATGEIMLVYLNNQKAKGDLFISYKNNGAFTDLIKLDETINSSAHEIAATISKDGETIFFASDREGGQGGTDIYISKKLPIGGWGPPQNLGANINTPFNEDFPSISPDGKTLYFSSKGHTSMGGYDIFKATYNETLRAFEKVQNVGYPLNTVFDDMNFQVSKTGRYGYIGALRPEGMGDYDIYRVIFNDIETNYSVIKGLIKSDSVAVNEIIIEITDVATGELYGSYQPNFNSMQYIMILPPGEYDLLVESPGFKSIYEKIKVLDKASFNPEIEKDISLLKE